MTGGDDRLAALVGSRLCHDLISPVGAIGNGIELITLEASTQTPEIDLLRQSVEAAGARLRLFRIAFGNVGEGDVVSREDLTQVLAGVYGASRLTVEVELAGGIGRGAAKVALLMALCLETTMPHGGTLSLADDDGRMVVRGTAARWRRDMDALWDLLDVASDDPRVTPATVHFPLVTLTSRAAGRRLTLDRRPDTITLSA